jgi:hypothetical protein
MRCTLLFRTTFLAAIAATLIGTGAPYAQEMAKRMVPVQVAPAPVDHDWTVITMAPDGATGVATAATAGQAIARAIRNCKAISGERIGCGAQSRAIRAGWIVAFRCGTRNIIAAEPSLGDAERRAAEREAELRRLYVPDLPHCRRVLTVDPQGGISMMGS